MPKSSEINRQLPLPEQPEIKDFVQNPKGQPIYFQFIRDRNIRSIKKRIVINTQLIGLSEEESREGRPDPFKIISTTNGREIKLLQSERLMVYLHPSVRKLNILPPDELIKNLQISQRIRKRKTPKMQEQSLIETS